MSLPTITIIGTGGLGTALARALSEFGIPIKSVFNRSGQIAEDLAGELSIPVFGSFPTDSEKLGKLVFITVSDRAIQEIAQRLAELDRDFSDRIFVHCSGNETDALLEPLKNKNAAVASFHPLQTFSSGASPDDFQDIYFSVQGDEEAYELLEDVAGKLGAHTIQISAGQKSRLHAAAVFASNYLATLLETATEIAASDELTREEAGKMLLPLIKTTLHNAETDSFGDALTGPIKRGDLQTVQKHLELLKGNRNFLDMYCSLGRQALRIAERNGSIEETTAEKMRTILNGD